MPWVQQCCMICKWRRQYIAVIEAPYIDSVPVCGDIHIIHSTLLISTQEKDSSHWLRNSMQVLLIFFYCVRSLNKGYGV